MNLGIEGKLALVSASSRGLGRSCADALASEGCRVAVCSRNEASAQKAAHEISEQYDVEAMGFEADLAKKEDIDRLINQVTDALGTPDILVTNAGGPPPGTFEATALPDYQKALDLNLMSAVHLIHHVYPAMKAKGWGRIIAITSISVKQPIGDLLLSNMARSGLTGFLKTIATELAPHGITVNALLPGTHKTKRVDKLTRDRAALAGKTEEEVYRQMVSAIPCGAFGNPSDFGAAAAFLASRQANFITGHNLLVDGGKYMGTL
ncbi:SDR family oxidoreductase [Desulfoluna spongiiphila]|uniref:3-oxoacyl-[acyl-carrier protein] reductase n=1 Tax=Desulfoluna spongiiphila TaxID=419481 RepID=A0A1G5BN14_9BACT|nr:SDR family oxidoreductase [Desulfoluna spongiiphila]SCX91467.1 3-oxoacyl-[acyl-carrier protein] reductase [Desulfoluna spongiiphila]VVS93821.1 enoyl-(acyl carrier protein) reductase [Desulfoluna spongiiphila]